MGTERANIYEMGIRPSQRERMTRDHEAFLAGSEMPDGLGRTEMKYTARNYVYLGAFTAGVVGTERTISTTHVHPLGNDDWEWKAVLKIATFEWYPEA